MLRTDSLVDTDFHPALNAVWKVPAQDIHVMNSNELVSKLLELNCCVSVPLRPQQIRTLAEN
jgi:hypothetical protein